MKKYLVLKRIVSFGLAMALVFSGPAVAFAQEHSTEVVVDTTEHTNEQGDSNKENNSSVVNSDVDNQDARESGQTGSDLNNSTEQGDKTDDTSEQQIDESENQTDDELEEADEKLDEDAKDLADKDSKDKDASEECDHKDFEYKSNEDGTHLKICKDCGEEVTEDCDFDENDKCKLCDYEKPLEERDDKIFQLTIGEFNIQAEVPAGAFDEDVEFKAKEVSLSSKEEELVNETVSLGEVEKTYAFDMYFEFDGKEIEPKEGFNVKISIESSNIDTDAVVHIKDDSTAEEVLSEIVVDKVSFEAESFSKYVLAGVRSENVLYRDSAYGSAYANQKHLADTYTFDKGYEWNRIALKVFQKNSYGEKFYPVQVAPAQSSDCYIYKTGVSDTFEVTFEAPENYYIANITRYDYYEHGEGEDDDEWYKKESFTPSDQHTTKYTIQIHPHRMNSWYKVINALLVDLEPINASLKKNYTEVNADLINYSNGNLNGKNDAKANRKFGDQFVFSSGQADPESNHCHYTSVYQGLAASTFENNTFKLANDNGVAIFPDYEIYKDKWWEYSYIDEYYNDTPVQFNLDEDGYWTLDSSQYKYIYKDGGIRPIKTSDKSQNQFRPFKDANGNYEDSHFGMLLPINFSVASSGLTNGKDTIFKFSGDDDVFVYVDGKLVLDLGGIHDIIKGQINFTTGEIIIQGDYGNEFTASWNDSVYYQKGIGDKNLYDIIPENNVAELSQKEHVLTVAYFERGAHLSNCKISYNFKKTETRTADFSGLKVDENHDGLAGAEFTLYTDYKDGQCSNVATVGIGTPAVAVSDENGTISFSGLSAGIIEDNEDSVSKTYYLMETKAPEGYNLPENAIWQLDFTVYKDTKKEPIRKLTALNAAAAALSLDKKGNQTSENVKAIENILTKQPKKLSVSKKVTVGSEGFKDTDAIYIFKILEITNDGVDIYTPMANQPYTINGQPLTTDEEGQFMLKADETALFENLMESRYQIIEVGVRSNQGYTLDNYETRISIDGVIDVNHVANVTFDATKEKAVEFENILSRVFDWQLVKVSTSGKTLMGAEFILTSENGDSKISYYGKSDENGLVKWYETMENMEGNKSPIVIPVGNYILSETKAPGGYAKSEDSWHVIIDRKDGLTAYKATAGDLKDRITVENQSLANGVTLKLTKLSFENTVAYTLPETGGRGAYIYTICGVLIMLGASLLLYKTRRNF